MMMMPVGLSLLPSSRSHHRARATKSKAQVLVEHMPHGEEQYQDAFERKEERKRGSGCHEF